MNKPGHRRFILGTSRGVIFLALVYVAFFAGPALRATTATYDWDSGDGTGFSWDQNANWTVLVNGNPSVGYPNSTVAQVTIGNNVGITLPGTYTVNTLSLSGSTTLSNGTLVLGGSSPQITTTTGGSLDLSTTTLQLSTSSFPPVATISTAAGTSVDLGNVTGTSELDLAGTGTVTLGGTFSQNPGTLNVNSGTLLVTGASAVLDFFNGYLYVGQTNPATVIISDGGTAQAGLVFDGYGSSSGTLTVTGTGSSLTAGLLYVGYYGGSSDLAISNAAKVTTGNLLVGYAVGGYSGTVTVDGAGSTLDVNLANGFQINNGSLAITNGGTLETTATGTEPAVVGLGAGGAAGAGTLTVSGTGSVWNNSGDLHVGDNPGGSATGTLTISAGGVVTTGTVTLGVNSGNQGTVDLEAGGTLATPQIAVGNGTGTLTFNGGTLQATTNSSDFISNFTGTEVNLESGGGTIDNNGYAITINSPLTGTGGATFTGSGTTALTAANTYSGGTTIESGTVIVGNSNAFGTGTVYTIDPTITYTNSVTVTNPIVMEGATTLEVDNTDSATQSGDISQSGGSYAITKIGSGTLTLSGSNSYTGGTTIDFGTLAVSGNSATIDSPDATTYVAYNNGDNATLAISNRGTVTDSSGFIGYFINSTGAATVTGAGSAWTNSVGLYVGDVGAGTLLVSGGGTVSSVEAYLGINLTSTGTVTVTGTGSTWTNDTDLNVGYDGTGTLLVSQGGKVSDYVGYIGYKSYGTGTVTVMGTGSTWTNSGDLIVGESGTGTLTVSQGGKVSDSTGYIGDVSGGTGTVTVMGTGSGWTNSRNLVVGYNGTGTLTVSAGGTVSDGTGYIGNNSGSTGSVTVTGTGSSWTNSSNIYVGDAGAGTLTVSQGGSVTDSIGYIGNASGITGSVTVMGAGSIWTNSGNLYVGYAGTGMLTVSPNGTVTDSTGYIGNNTGISGSVTVSGTGSAWTNSSNLVVGYNGTGTLLVSDSGMVTDSTGYIGNQSGGTGNVTVTGTGSTWKNSSNLVVGDVGAGTLTVSAGGTVMNNTGYIGNNVGGVGSVTVDGAGSAWSNSTTLYVGDSGTGNLTVSNGGEVSIANGTGTLELGAQAGSSGTLNIGSADLANPTASGTLQASHVTFGAGTGLINFNQTDTITFAAAISGAGSVVQRGTGTTTLTGMNTYSGATTISGGTLALGSGGSISSSSGVNLAASGATFDISNGGLQTIQDLTGTAGSTVNLGSQILVLGTANSTTFAGNIIGVGGSLTKTNAGTLTLSGNNTYSGGTTITGGALMAESATALGVGNVSVQGGMLAVGDGTHPQTLAIGGYYTQAGGGTLYLSLHSNTTYDQVNVAGSASLGGTLTVNFNGNPTAPGAAPGSAATKFSYTLLTSSNETGAFTAFDPLNEPSNDSATLVYQNNDVILDVSAAAVMFPTNIPGLTPNQQSVLVTIDAGLGGSNPPPAFVALTTALGTVYMDDPGAFGAVLGQLTPLNFANFNSSTAFNNASLWTEQLDAYLADHRGPDGTFVGSAGGLDTSSLSVNDPNVDPGLQGIHSRLLAWDPPPSTGLLSDTPAMDLGGVDMKDSKEMLEINEPANPWDVFISGNVVLAQDFSDSAAGLSHADATTGAVSAGADYKITPHFLVGAEFAYGHTYATLDDIGSTASVDTYSPGVYASYSEGGWYANAIGSYGFANYNQSRNVAIGAFTGTANSHPGGDQIIGDLDGGYDFHCGHWTLGPTLGVQYAHLDVDGYSETGLPGADLTVNANEADSLRSSLGERISYAVHDGGVLFNPHLSAAWQHEFMDQSRGITSQFSGLGAGSFVVKTPNPSRDSALVDVGLDAQVNNALTVFTDYTVQAGQSNYFGQSIQAGFKIGF